MSVAAPVSMETDFLCGFSCFCVQLYSDVLFGVYSVCFFSLYVFFMTELSWELPHNTQTPLCVILLLSF